MHVCVCTYLVLDALVPTWAECRDNTHAVSVSVKPLLTGAALDPVATGGRGGVNVPAGPLTHGGVGSHAGPPALPCWARCTQAHTSTHKGLMITGALGPSQSKGDFKSGNLMAELGQSYWDLWNGWSSSRIITRPTL